MIGYAIAGALGALARDVVKDNKLQLPRYRDGAILLGFIGGMLVGAFVGWSVDSSFLTASMAGYVGTSAIGHLMPADGSVGVK